MPCPKAVLHLEILRSLPQPGPTRTANVPSDDCIRYLQYPGPAGPGPSPFWRRQAATQPSSPSSGSCPCGTPRLMRRLPTSKKRACRSSKSRPTCTMPFSRGRMPPLNPVRWICFQRAKGPFRHAYRCSELVIDQQCTARAVLCKYQQSTGHPSEGRTGGGTGRTGMKSPQGARHKKSHWSMSTPSC